MNLAYGDGLTIEIGGTSFVADASAPEGDVAIVSHAHGDHLYTEPPTEAVWSPLTRDLAAKRRGAEPVPETVNHPAVDLLDAGHVPGSRAALVHGQESVLYTGDVCTRDRLYLDGFDPPAADVLVVESTYGRPTYVFPPVEGTRADFQAWVAEHGDRPVICFGYALGRAQEIEYLLAGTDRERILVSDAIAAIDETIEAHRELSFPGRRYDDASDLGVGDALVLPSRLRNSWVDDLIAETDAATAGLSGWAVDDGFRFARDLDAGFVLSDHCDFTELVALVRAVDPDRVYTLHGSAGEFADHLTGLGFEATALKPNQSRLSEF